VEKDGHKAGAIVDVIGGLALDGLAGYKSGNCHEASKNSKTWSEKENIYQIGKTVATAVLTSRNERSNNNNNNNQNRKSTSM
jgi:hypothetical protein